MKIITFFLLLTFPLLNLWASLYTCNINLMKVSQEVPLDQINKYIHHFLVKLDGPGKGLKTSFNNITAYLWWKKKMIFLKAKDANTKNEFISKYSPLQEEIYLSITPGFLIQCLTQKAFEELSSSSAKKTFALPFDNNSRLEFYLNGLEIRVNKDLLFKYVYNRGEVYGKMNALFFQNGQIIQRHEKKEGKNWCIFQVQTKLDENTTIFAQTQIPIIQTTVNNSGKNHKALIYSFVNFSKGQKGFETEYYAPFQLKCSFPKDKPFTYKVFKQVTGDHFTIEVLTHPSTG